MIGPKKVVAGLLLFLVLLCVISFGTKGAHWDKIHNKAYWIDSLPNIYRPMEGCIVLDVFLVLLYITVLGLLCRPKDSVANFVFWLLVLMLCLRFLLGVIFLAGENEKGRVIVNDWLTMDQSMKNQLTEDTKDYYKTFEGAYVYEIIDIIMMSVLNPMMLLLWRHSYKNMENIGAR